MKLKERKQTALLMYELHQGAKSRDLCDRSSFGSRPTVNSVFSQSFTLNHSWEGVVNLVEELLQSKATQHFLGSYFPQLK